MFSTVRPREGNIKRYRNSAMFQRWLATVLLHCEKGFRRVKGYLGITEVIATIEQIQEEKYVYCTLEDKYKKYDSVVEIESGFKVVGDSDEEY